MKAVFRVIKSADGISNLEGKEENVHFAFRPSERNIFGVLAKCRKLKRIQLPHSYEGTLSKTVRMLLEMKGAKLLIGDVWGHRTDIDRFAEIEVE